MDILDRNLNPRAALMLDLCSGLGGASQAFRDRGWRVITIDNDPKFAPLVITDICDWSWDGERPDFIWASPPCREFAKESMPWCKTGIEPDVTIALACKRIIDECQPRYWVIENVRGAQKWLKPFLGNPTLIINPYYFWGSFPPISRPKLTRRNKESMSSTWAAERARIPPEISKAFCIAIESQMRLPI